jgi:hypothetical protein
MGGLNIRLINAYLRQSGHYGDHLLIDLRLGLRDSICPSLDPNIHLGDIRPETDCTFTDYGDGAWKGLRLRRRCGFGCRARDGE